VTYLIRRFGSVIFSAVLLSAALSFVGSAFAATIDFPRRPTKFKHPYQDGFVFVLWADYSDAAINGFLDNIKTSGSISITLPYFGCQSSITSADVGSCQLSNAAFTNLADLNMLARQNDSAVHIAQLAIAKGMSPIFLPIVATPKWDWRGYFDPTDPKAWFASYTAWMKTVAAQAKSLNMDELIVASEFSKLYQYSDQWKTFLKTIRKDFKNPLIVTVNWGQLDFKFWNEADAIGVSEYYPLTTLTAPTQADLDQGAQAVKAQIMAASKKYHRPIFLTEVGFPSTSACATQPWAVSTTDQENWALQADCFDAFKEAWQDETQLVHVGFWATGDSSSDPQFPISYEVFGKPAEKVVEDFISERSHLSIAH
jgi:hypothetical protein